MSVCTIQLLRHGEHVEFGHKLTGRCAGVGLSAAGLRQARRVAARYAGSDVRAVLTSPVQRAWETAEAVGAVLGLAPDIAPGLEEVDFGSWAGQSFADLKSEPGWEEWNAARSLAPTPGGETMLAVQARAVETLMAQRSGGGIVVAVSHADVIKAVLAYVLGMPLDLMHRLEIGAGSQSVVVLGQAFARVEAVNILP